jgi:hypothetical protein
MSDEDAIRSAIDAWNAGGVDAFLEHVTPDVEWHPPPGFPEGDLFSGRDSVAAALSDQFEAVFSSGRVEIRSVTAGPAGWLVDAHHEVEGQASGMDLEWSIYLVFELERDLINQMWAFLERPEALRQAGIDG